MAKKQKEICLEVIKQRVLSLALEPGQLLDETTLSNELGLSRTPLREVFQRLCGEGYLVARENRGAQVSPMDFVTLRHFFQAAPMVYSAIAKLAAEQARPADIDALWKIQKGYRAAISQGNPGQMVMSNHEFHVRIGHMAASPYLLPSFNRLLIDHTRIGHTFYRSISHETTSRISVSADQHDQMIEAFARHEPAAAVDVTLKHWDLSRDQMARFVSPDPLQFDLPEQKDEPLAV